MRYRLLLILPALFLPLALAAQIVGDFTGGDNLSVGPGTAGFSFTTASAPVTIAALGVFDADNDGIVNAHQVGIWDTATQVLLGSATVQPGSPEQNSFVWSNLSNPLVLQASHTYTLGASYIDTDLDLARGNVSTLTMNESTFTDARLSSGTGFGFPDVVIGGGTQGYFGPDAGFSAVPEPQLYSIIAAAILVLFCMLRKVRQFVKSAKK